MRRRDASFERWRASQRRCSTHDDSVERLGRRRHDACRGRVDRCLGRPCRRRWRRGRRRIRHHRHEQLAGRHAHEFQIDGRKVRGRAHAKPSRWALCGRRSIVTTLPSCDTGNIAGNPARHRPLMLRGSVELSSVRKSRRSSSMVAISSSRAPDPLWEGERDPTVPRTLSRGKSARDFHVVPTMRAALVLVRDA